MAVGKTDDKNFRSLLEGYKKRLGFYVSFEMQIIPDIKNAKTFSEIQQKQKEGEILLKFLEPSDVIFLLDEHGENFSSIAFSDFIQKKMNSGIKNLIFIIGGPYGFSEAMYARANGKISLSAMTFSHQMVRLFFIEQLYRAFTILRNEPYHHQ